MTLPRPTGAAALAALLVCLSPGPARQTDPTNPFQFSRDPTRSDVTLTPNPNLRTNTEQTWYLWVANPDDVARDMQVELVVGGVSVKSKPIPGAKPLANNQ